MLKLTKKDFLKLHKANELFLLASVDLPKEKILSRCKEIKDFTPYLKKTSSVDVGNQKDQVLVSIYKEDNFIFVESFHDLSKDRYTSRNDIIVNTIIYMIK